MCLGRFVFAHFVAPDLTQPAGRTRSSKLLTDSPAGDPAVGVVGPDADVRLLGHGDGLDGLAEVERRRQVHHPDVVPVSRVPVESWMLWTNKNVKRCEQN